MEKPKVLITLPRGSIRDSFFPQALVQLLEKRYTLLWNDSMENWTSVQLQERINPMHGVVLGWGAPFWTSEVVARLENLKCIGILGGAVRPYLGPEVFLAEIPVFNSSEIMAESVAEAVIAYALTALRALPEYMGAMKTGRKWREPEYFIEGLLYQKVGLIGYGAVGRYLAKQLQAFNTDLLIYDPYFQGNLPPRATLANNLGDIFAESKIISLQAAYTSETHHLINQTYLDQMKSGTLFINVGRGGLVDEEALIRRLQKGDVKAVLDVFAEEPLSLESSLRKIPNAYLVPHMAGPTPDLRWKMAEKVFNDFDAVFHGQPYSNNLSWAQVQAMT